MKTGIMLLISVLLSFSLSGASPLKYGTPVSLQMKQSLCHKQKGRTEAFIYQDIMDSTGSRVLIAKGTPVYLNVVSIKAKGLGQAGKIKIYPLSTYATDGQIIILSGKIEITGKNRRKLTLGLGIGTGLTCLPGIGFCLLTIKGGNARIPAGTILENLYVGNNYHINATNIK